VSLPVFIECTIIYIYIKIPVRVFAVPKQIFADDDVKLQDGILLWAQLDINAAVRGDYLSTHEASLHLRKAVCAI
jgi:hypothetical protein